jgi:hypothetical protein
MIVKNLMFNTEPSVIHANGMGADAVLNILRKMDLEYEFTDPYDPNPIIKENWFRIISTGKFLSQENIREFFKFPQEELNPELAIITWTDAIDKNAFELILKAYNIPYHNLVNSGQKYQSMLKIINTLKFLKTTTAKYIFGCDAKDVFILNHPNYILKSFLNKFPNHKMLINGELNDSPQFITTFEHESFKHHNSPYRFVNSGVSPTREDHLENEFIDSLRFSSRFFDRYPLLKLKEFRVMVINHLMDSFHGEFSDWGLKDFPYEDIQIYFTKRFNNRIIEKYNEMKNGE